MKTKNDSRTKRRVVETYKGFDIIKVIVEYFHKSFYGYEYDDDWVDRRTVYFDFCKEGEGKKSSQAYSVYAKNISDCKECIDKFIEDDSLYFTDEEVRKYVTKPNHDCGWAYGYDSLMKLMKQHQKADKRMKRLIEDRLSDANFHSEAGFLSQEDYVGFTDLVRKTYKFCEKFEIYTETMGKRIDNPKGLEEGLKMVINDFLKKRGIEDTDVKVNFVENW